MLITFSSPCLVLGQNDCLILPLILMPSYETQTAMSSTSQQTMFGYVTLLAAQPLLSMHARIISNCYPVTPWIGLSPYLLSIVVDDMTIIYNVDYIRRRMEGLGYPAPTLCSIRVT